MHKMMIDIDFIEALEEQLQDTQQMWRIVSFLFAFTKKADYTLGAVHTKSFRVLCQSAGLTQADEQFLQKSGIVRVAITRSGLYAVVMSPYAVIPATRYLINVTALYNTLPSYEERLKNKEKNLTAIEIGGKIKIVDKLK